MATRLEGHTFRRFDGELARLHTEILQMADLVYDQIQMALESFQQQKLDIIRVVNEREPQVDAMEKSIDNTITEILAKRCPVARDLRVIMAFSKLVTDLERLGDEAAKIAYITTTLYNNEHSNPSNYLLRDITVMGKFACALLKEAIENLDILDLERAEKLLNSHDDLDEEFQSSLRRLATYVLEDARNVGHIINIVLVMKSLIRIGEHARNLAEYVVYMVSGEDIRHAEIEQT
ncbi:phosphate signaling complex protein PhoU [Nitrosomonas communis]|uniref:Phosphate-specific transport system accessory protein PhoU n=1 Tax=Nitrosomonas communis TaxID=44574 RepID=A0A1I4LAH6_9PROT|nr:phosphate signaling complex protein PhoU [Nitrosomonas communis]SFL87647.1 phosphate transport system protein [Nitrosomonas communis]